MNTLVCQQGCCSLKILSKFKQKNYDAPYPFEKRKAGVLVCCGTKVLLTQSYNSCWGIPKGKMELFDSSTKSCAERELKEETGLVITLEDKDLYRIILDNCYVYRIFVENMDIINVNNLANLDSTGIGWVDFECAFDFNINFLTRKILMEASPNYD
jgi:8-oxo-dGTP pyrophosphatase MutT (NUDIX family)